MTKPNDNHEEDLDLENDDVAEGEDESSSGAEDEEAEDGEEADPEEGADEGEEDDDEGEDDGEGEDDEEGDDEDPDYDPKLDPSGKFKGKSKKEILKSYRQLETSIGEKAQKLAQDILKKKGVKAKPTAEDAEDADGEEFEFELGLTDEQIANMKPGEFGKVLSRKILEKATEIARNTIERTTEVRGNVQREIRETTKEYPQLKENPGFRKVVISLIQAAAGKDEVLSLKDACKEAQEITGIKPKKKEGEGEGDGGDGKGKKKPNRMSVEKPGGSDGKPVKSDADRVREGLLGGRSSTDAVLGGLGV